MQIDPTELTSMQTILGDLKQIPYCTGTVPLAVNAATLFYRSGDKSDFVDFSNPTNDQLEKLAKACEPATFGLNQQDVYDEDYRKAGKMDVDRFSTQFQPFDQGIVEVIQQKLLGGRVDMASIRVELYKLNIYGPGGFFKAHVDTPRGDDMFGSLVVILPTIHEGGSLLLCKGGNEWTFDSAKAVRSPDTPSASTHAAFISFFSDVEHQVTPVSSGYRVTLTYNLYRKPTTSSTDFTANTEAEERVRETLSRLLEKPSFFSNGGRLGFGLDHQYAINPKKTQLKDVERQLKGIDETLMQICQSLSLRVAVKAVYRHMEDHYTRSGVEKHKTTLAVLIDHFPRFGDGMFEGDQELLDCLERRGGEIVKILGGKELKPPQSVDIPRTARPIVWIKPLSETNEFSDPYIGYGNEASLEHVYGEVCLIADVDPAEQRMGL